VGVFLFDGNWLWRAKGFAAAKTPATLLRRKSAAAWFRGDGVPQQYHEPNGYQS